MVLEENRLQALKPPPYMGWLVGGVNAEICPGVGMIRSLSRNFGLFTGDLPGSSMHRQEIFFP
jgi:hypothetical protein